MVKIDIFEAKVVEVSMVLQMKTSGMIFQVAVSFPRGEVGMTRGSSHLGVLSML